MSFHRVVFVALATLFTVGMASGASACCGFAGDGCCGMAAPVVYAAPAPVAVAPAPIAVVPAPIAVTVAATPFGGPCCSWNGCGDCGGWSGCGNCGGGFPAAVGCGTCGGGWGGALGRCGNCGGCGGCGPVAYAAPQLYVVNQGPVYSGPGLTVPYQTYSPETAYAPAADYPYVPGYGVPPVPGYPYAPGYGAAQAPIYPPLYHHLYARPRYAYRGPVYAHPRRVYGPYGAPHWRHYP